MTPQRIQSPESMCMDVHVCIIAKPRFQKRQFWKRALS
jgi:hypothetical protein